MDGSGGRLALVSSVVLDSCSSTNSSSDELLADGVGLNVAAQLVV